MILTTNNEADITEGKGYHRIRNDSQKKSSQKGNIRCLYCKKKLNTFLIKNKNGAFFSQNLELRIMRSKRNLNCALRQQNKLCQPDCGPSVRPIPPVTKTWCQINLGQNVLSTKSHYLHLLSDSYAAGNVTHI